MKNSVLWSLWLIKKDVSLSLKASLEVDVSKTCMSINVSSGTFLMISLGFSVGLGWTMA